jgi:hypothetical protein
MGIMSDYEYSVAYHKGAFAVLLNLKNVIEHFKNGPHSKLIPKKVYKLLLSYLDVALHNIDEFMDYGGVRYIIIDKDNNCQRVSEQEALNFISENRKKYEEKKKAAH